MKYITKQDYQKWCEETGYRGIGGSHVSALMCDSPYSSKYKLYKEIIEGRNKTEQTVRMTSGIELEEWVVTKFLSHSFSTRLKVDEEYKEGLFVSEKYPFLVASTDRILINELTGERSVLECKTTEYYNKDKWEGGNMPDEYYWQCIHYLLITGLSNCFICCAVGFSQIETRLITVHDYKTKQDIALLEKELLNFWNNHVLTNTPPEIDHKTSTRETLDQQAETKEPAIQLDSHLDMDFNRRIILQEEIKERQEELDKINNKIRFAMGGFGKAESNYFKVSYSKTTTTTFDKDALKAEHPEIYNNFTKTNTFTRLTITPKKKEESNDSSSN